MKIFISWSGERSETLAKSLREWIPLVLHFADPWLSKADIQAGERWSVEIAKELEATKFGILCITKENMNSPWILFEAGALAKSMQDGGVMPLLLDIDFKEISGPLAQFQAKKSELIGVKELIWSLNKASSSPVPEPQLEKLFEALWPQLEAKISEIPKTTALVKHARPQGEILEELVSSVRGVEMRVREAMDDEVPWRHRRRHKIHPMMYREQMYRLGEDSGPALRILVLSSIFREDFPWVYELGVEAYRAIKSGKSEKVREALDEFSAAFENLRRGPFLEDAGMDMKMVRHFIHEAFEAIGHANFNLSSQKTGSKRVRARGGIKAD